MTGGGGGGPKRTSTPDQTTTTRLKTRNIQTLAQMANPERVAQLTAALQKQRCVQTVQMPGVGGPAPPRVRAIAASTTTMPSIVSAAVAKTTTKNVYSGTWKPSCAAIVAGIALVLAFFACIMIAVVYYNGCADEAAFMGELRSNMSAMALRLETGRAAAHDNVAGVMTPALKSVNFELRGPPGHFMRWPAQGSLDTLLFSRVVYHRLCCHVGGQYVVCDSGQGATDTVGLECIVQRDTQDTDNKDGAHLLVWMHSEHMEGAQCRFTWHEEEMNDQDKSESN